MILSLGFKAFNLNMSKQCVFKEHNLHELCNELDTKARNKKLKIMPEPNIC